jgi:uncharacterized protein YgiM (DUF1202 family)
MHNKKIKRLLATAIFFTILITNSRLTADATVLSDMTVGAGVFAKATEEVSILESINPNTAQTEDAAEEQSSYDSTESVKTPAVTAGAGGVVVDSIEFEEEDDAQEDAAGVSFGYTNLGIANVEDHLNVRATADEGSKIVGKMTNNAGCEVLAIEGNMARIASGSVEGYVSLDYLLMGQSAIERATEIIQKLATVNADGLKLREEPSTESAVVNMVAYGEELPVVDDTLDGWVAVSFDGQIVYVSADYVSVDEKLKTALNMTEFLYGEGVSDIRVELCEYAKQFLGNPYVWGGTSLTKGADCSGFVLSVFAKYGISLPHSSRAQATMGTAVDISEAKPGDLVFYAKGSRINHVGIYIGGGQIINASSPKTGIRISNVYYRTPVAVRRILQD